MHWGPARLAPVRGLQSLSDLAGEDTGRALAACLAGAWHFSAKHLVPRAINGSGFLNDSPI